MVSLKRALNVILTLALVPFGIMVSQMHQAQILWLMCPVVVATLVVLVRIAWNIKCPRCRRALAYPTRRSGHLPAELHCPHCGLDFDQPMPH